MSDAPVPPRPLLATADPVLLDDVVRLAAVAGLEMHVAADAGAARAAWVAAPAVLVGGDLAGELAAATPPRREAVVVVSRDLDDAGVWQRAVTLGAGEVVFLPDADEWLVDWLADRTCAPGEPAPCVAVVGGRGGAGATTLAAALGVTAVRTGRRTMLVDGDPLGGGIDLVFGAEGADGLRWPQLAGAHGRLSAATLDAALPRVEELTVLSWDRADTAAIPAPAMSAVLAAGRRGNELVVVDLPRRFDPATDAALAAATVTLLVVPAEVRAAASAARVAAALAGRCPDVRLVVRGPAPAGLDGSTIAGTLGLPLAGQLRPEPGLAAAQERGEPPGRRASGPLASFCRQFLAGLPSGSAAA